MSHDIVHWFIIIIRYIPMFQIKGFHNLKYTYCNVYRKHWLRSESECGARIVWAFVSNARASGILK